MKNFGILAMVAMTAAMIGVSEACKAGEYEKYLEPVTVDALVFQVFEHKELPADKVDGTEMSSFELLHYLADGPTVCFKQESGDWVELAIVEKS